MRTLKEIAIHCSATPDASDFGFQDVNEWHLDNGWKSPKGIGCGYHFLIRKDGTIEVGRTLDEAGAHVKGANEHTIGICLIGTHEFNAKQFNAMKQLVDYLKIQFGELDIWGHREYPSGQKQKKSCPNIDMIAMRSFLAGQKTVGDLILTLK